MSPGANPAAFRHFSEKCVMNNYFGIGLDAKISLEFNNKRDEHPKKCRLAETPLGKRWMPGYPPSTAPRCPFWEGLPGWVTGMLERTAGLPGCWEETAGRDCQDARKDHRDSRMLGRAAGMPGCRDTGRDCWDAGKDRQDAPREYWGARKDHWDARMDQRVAERDHWDARRDHWVAGKDCWDARIAG